MSFLPPIPPRGANSPDPPEWGLIQRIKSPLGDLGVNNKNGAFETAPIIVFP